MQIISLADIQSVVTDQGAIEAVKSGFVAMAQGHVKMPSPMQILFNDERGELRGDCHVKAAQALGSPYFVIKVAAGFYGNPAGGLPVNSGLVLVISADTGIPVALLRDEGWLTQMRTAAAGALAAGLKQLTGHETLGIIGTGTQAALQARMICRHLRLSSVSIYGRSANKAAELRNQLKADGFQVSVAPSVRELCYSSAIVVTTTPSQQPILSVADVPDRLHIVAVGADSPGKIELDPEIFARADIIATDDHAQCLHHGDFGAAVRAGAIREDSDVSFCKLLAGQMPEVDFSTSKISVVDLTGLGIQDLAIASLVMESASRCTNDAC